jgi:glycosyltransferase involved in cell wall biosynthesis
MSNPLVSFIIPYFNAGSTIQETIDSVFNQSYPNFDIWIINDGSTDKLSIEKLKDFEGNDKIHILHQENAGPSVARNNAIKRTKSDFILPLDADDKILNKTIIHCLNEFNNDNEIGVVYGNLHFFGETTFIKDQAIFYLNNQLLWNQVAVCSLIRKGVFEDIGFYDEKLSKIGLEDWEFWIRVGISKWKFKKVNELHFQIRTSKHSRTFAVANKNVSEIKEYVFKKHYSSIIDEYSRLLYDKKMLLETPDYKIGNLILSPYRFIKKLFK